MKNFLVSVFRSPEFELDMVQRRRAEFIHYSTILLVIFSAALIALNLVFEWNPGIRFYGLVAAIAAAQVVIQWLLRSRHADYASLLQLSLFWVIVTIINRTEGGVRDVGTVGYVIILLTSATLFGWRVTVVFTLASIAAIWWMAFLEFNGELVPNLGSPIQIALILTLVFGLILFMVYLLLRALTTALERAQRELSERLRIEGEREALIARLSNEIAEREKAQEQLQHLARTDALTGLYNRRYFLDVAAQEFHTSVRYGRFLSVMIFDLDYFKRVNDTYGHLAGDAALAQVGNFLRQHIRESDVAARYGGEEFIVLLPETNLQRAQLLAERLRDLIEKAPVQVETVSIPLTVSIGVAERNSSLNENTVEQLISHADAALYLAKKSGRNRVCCYA